MSCFLVGQFALVVFEVRMNAVLDGELAGHPLAGGRLLDFIFSWNLLDLTARRRDCNLLHICLHYEKWFIKNLKYIDVGKKMIMVEYELQLNYIIIKFNKQF